MRVGFVLVAGGSVDSKYYEFGRIADNIAAGNGYAMHWYYHSSDPARMALQALPPQHEGAYMPPVISYMISTAFELFGSRTAGAAMALMLFQALVGAFAPVLLYYATRASASESAARLATIALTFFPPVIYSTATFSGSVLYQTGGIAVMMLAVEAASRPSTRRFVLLGLACGAMAMTRSEFLAVGIVIIAASALLAGLRGRGGSASHALVAALSLLVVIAPWAIRNYRIFDRIVPTISHPWGEIWRGNNPYAEASSYDEEGEANWFLKPYYRPLARRLDSLPYDSRFELAADSVFRDEVLAYVRAAPQRALGVAAGRIVLLWSFDLNHPAARNPLYIAIIVPTLLLLAAGFVLTIRRSRRSGEWAPVVIYGIFFLCTSGIVAITHVQPRHQIYMVAVGFPFVGVALARMVGEGRGMSG